MNSMIICEGYTDLALVQYFMEIANGWIYSGDKTNKLGCKLYRRFNKANSSLIIGEVGGCGNIAHCLSKVIERNVYSQSGNELYNNIVIIADRDEVETVEEFNTKLNECFSKWRVDFVPEIKNNTWVECAFNNVRGMNASFRVLLLIIPFEDTGALETFLLSSISNQDPYDKQIIEEGKRFVETIDPEERYLRHRRHKTKSKFDVYFSVRTPFEQFGKRRDILRGVPWEKYKMIQNCFVKLSELG